LSKELNIVTLNIPYPPDYGGMIDTYYRIKALHDQGVIIHLHCFEYGRQHSVELESICETITYYPRKTSLRHHISLLPFIVNSRKSKILLANLQKNDFPVLFDGLHSTYYINHPALFKRNKLVRMHNIEHDYYMSLARHEKSLIKKFYFISESKKLRWYEKRLCNAKHVLTISETDQLYFKMKYNNSIFVAPAHPFKHSENLPGAGDYVLYHGDLSVNENAAIAWSLITGVFSRLPSRCIIAGKNPPVDLLLKVSQHPNIRLVANPGINEMKALIMNAHVNIIAALSANGFKLKLLVALYSGRHCIVNEIVARNNVCRSLCHEANSDEELVEMIKYLMAKPFTEENAILREKFLAENFNNSENAKKIINLL